MILHGGNFGGYQTIEEQPYKIFMEYNFVDINYLEDNTIFYVTDNDKWYYRNDKEFYTFMGVNLDI